MSENNTENNETVESPEGQPKKESNPIKDNTQYLIGAISGVITCGAIFLSGKDLNTTDGLITKLVEYSFLIAFLIFMLGVRKVEADRNISMRKTRTAYMIAIGAGIVVFLIMALTSGPLPFTK